MKRNGWLSYRVVVGWISFLCLSRALAQTNSWTSPGSGKWEDAANWSLATAPASGQSIFITNAAGKTVTIDSATTTASSTLAVSNVTVGAAAGTNTLMLTNAGILAPLRVVDTCTIFTGGALSVMGSALYAETLSDSGTIILDTGSVVTDSVAFIGGSVTISDGTWQTGYTFFSAGSTAAGALTVAGGTVTVSGHLGIGTAGTGTVWVTGGQLTVNYQYTTIGNGSVGNMTVSNGAVTVEDVIVRSPYSGESVLSIVGGTLTAAGNLYINDSLSNEPGTGTVWVLGGALVATNGVIYISYSGFGRMSVSNGTVLARSIIVGDSSDSQGILAAAGGSISVQSNLLVGVAACSSTGTVSISGGLCAVTNANHSAVLEVRSGTVIVNSGTLLVDTLVITNACGHFIHTGGTVIVGSLVLDPNLSATGDGLPNWWKQKYGLDPLSTNSINGVNGDPDGDGLSNLQEYLAGTDPTNSASYFHILSITSSGSDVLVIWTCGGGRTNIVQAASGLGGGYSDISSNIIILGTGDNTTNFLDTGALTNTLARFYRVRLVP